jgi:hypothetical protein
VEIGPGQTYAACEGDTATVNEMRAVPIDEVGKSGRTTNSGKSDDLFVFEIPFLEEFIECSEHGEVAAARAPCGVIGGDSFLC